MALDGGDPLQVVFVVVELQVLLELVQPLVHIIIGVVLNVKIQVFVLLLLFKQFSPRQIPFRWRNWLWDEFSLLLLDFNSVQDDHIEVPLLSLLRRLIHVDSQLELFGLLFIG